MSSENEPVQNVEQQASEEDVFEPGKPTEKSDHEFVKPAPPPLAKVMQQEEAKFKSKYGNLKPCGGSALLTKRLQKQKFFDSGDYNMAKAKMNNPKKPLPAQEKLILQETLGDAIPTPETIATRKPSLIQSKLVDGSLS